jgi:hypothetical protein
MANATLSQQGIMAANSINASRGLPFLFRDELVFA